MHTIIKNKYILILAATMGLASCDFLDREPLDFGSEDSYYRTVDDIRIAVNDFYEILPTNKSLWGGLYSQDVQSDNQCSAGLQNLFYRGEKKTVKMGSSQWDFSNLRGINFFINKTEEKLEAIGGNRDYVNHYLGEGYFFRAYDYFRLLRNYGDVPILTKVLGDDKSELTAASVRSPRNEVARFILSDLDKAISLLMEKAPESGRITRDAAWALKSRVALYEATWEKYHAGTCFVPGNSKWPGAATWTGFQFKAGSAEAEIEWLLDQAIEASQVVADAHPLDADYASMFNSAGTFGDGDEVILARYYLNGVLSHSCSAFLRAGGGCGLTRAAVNSFLMTNGLPIYADGSEYQGDEISYYEFQNRDTRLTSSVRPAGRLINTTQVDGKYVNDTIYYWKPYIYMSGNEKSTTGYELKKWLSDDPAQRIQYACTTTVPLFRSAEARLNYLEAYYERHHSLDSKCAQYWGELRSRAGVSTDYSKTIAATDLSKENDLGVWSRSQEVDKTLYNIRRERRCELIAEGMRLDDLKRWRALDMMNGRGNVGENKDLFTGYQPEGFNLWTEMYKMYSSKEIDETVVSQSNISKYLHPLQVSSTSAAYEGYDFPKQHYLEPIPISEFLLTVDGATGASTIYQNPGWPSKADGTADYSFDCD